MKRTRGEAAPFTTARSNARRSTREAAGEGGKNLDEKGQTVTCALLSALFCPSVSFCVSLSSQNQMELRYSDARYINSVATVCAVEKKGRSNERRLCVVSIQTLLPLLLSLSLPRCRSGPFAETQKYSRRTAFACRRSISRVAMPLLARLVNVVGPALRGQRSPLSTMQHFFA